MVVAPFDELDCWLGRFLTAKRLLEVIVKGGRAIRLPSQHWGQCRHHQEYSALGRSKIIVPLRLY